MISLEMNEEDARSLYKLLRELKDRRQVNLAIGGEYLIDRITSKLIEMPLWTEECT
ncbi:MAG: hypothetical protein ACYDH4_11475 [Candidatus Cryosericum sp.]